MKKIILAVAVSGILAGCVSDRDLLVDVSGETDTLQAQPLPSSETIVELDEVVVGNEVIIGGEAIEESVLSVTYFGFDKSTVPPVYQRDIRVKADLLKQYPNDRIILQGFTDDRGTREYNLALGERRANAVKRELIKYGINASRITVVSYGKDFPASYEQNSEGWAKNRRVVMVLDRGQQIEPVTIVKLNNSNVAY